MGLEALNKMTVESIKTTPIGDIMAACGYENGSVELENNFRDNVVAAAREGTITQDKKDALTSNTTTLVGGKRGKKGTKKRKEPSVLASWRKFVRKVQHEEKITYPEAMKRASKRKSEWQRGGADMDDDDDDDQEGGSAGAVQDFDENYSKQYGSVGGRSRRRSRRQRGGIATTYSPASPASVGGSRRRRGTKKRRGSRRYRR
jgi:hypothetical protein